MKEEKKLQTFWQKLANGSHVAVVYQPGNYKLVKMPKPITKKYKHRLLQLNNNERVKAIVTSAQSWDSFNTLKNKVKRSSLQNILNGYKRLSKMYEEVTDKKGNGIKITKYYSL